MSKGKTLLPQDFTINPTMRAWADKKVPTLDVDYYHDEFVDHWCGNGKMMKDWLSTWRNWMRRTDRGSGPGMYGPEDRSIVRKKPRPVNSEPAPPTKLETRLDELDKMRRQVFSITGDLHTSNRMTPAECRQFLVKGSRER